MINIEQFSNLKDQPLCIFGQNLKILIKIRIKYYTYISELNRRGSYVGRVGGWPTNAGQHLNLIDWKKRLID